MAYRNDDEEIECEIIKSFGIFSPGVRNWNKEVNLVSWNGRPPKLDIRNWQKNHEKCGKGIALTREEAEELVKLLNKILKAKPSREKSSREKPSGEKSTREKASREKSTREKTSGAQTEKRSRKKKILIPQNLEPFYDELELLFGSDPEECKSARNALLKKYHPDKNLYDTAFATRKTIKIKEAYDKIIAFWKENS